MKKKWVNIVIIGLFLIFSLIYGEENSSKKNLLSGGSFETKRPWSLWPGGRTKTTFSIDKTIYKEGKASAKIVAIDIKDKGALYTYCPMKEGKTYKITLWYKTKNLLPDSSSLKLLLNFNLKNGRNGSAGQKIIPFPSGDTNTDWKEFTTIVTPPPGTFVCQFVLRCSNIIGTVWFDGITVIEQEGEKKNRLLYSKLILHRLLMGKKRINAGRNLI